MQKAASSSVILFLLLVFTCTQFFGQVSSVKKPLINILKNIETKHQIRFSYATDEIDGINIVAPSEEDSLDQVLSYLIKVTSLTFHRIDDRYITVRTRNQLPDIQCGTIIDADTGLALQGASIESSNKRTTIISNDEGTFTIDQLAKTKYLKISYLGYEDLIIETTELNGNCPEFELLAEISELDPVHIKHFFTKGIDKHLDGAFVIRTKKIGLLPGQTENDVFQIIQALPGVESIDETISNINIRGGTTDENLVLWDDIKMYQNGHFFGLISAFNPDLTEEVTVYKNGTNARYGEGVSSVIDMKSNKDIASKWQGGAGFNLINASVFLEIPIMENLSLQVSGRSSINNIIETNIYNAYSNKIFQDTEIVSFLDTDLESGTVSADEDFSFYDVSGKVLWNFSEKDKLRLNFLNINNTLDFTEILDATDESKTSNLKQRNTAGGVSWHHQWTDRIESTLLAYGSNYVLNSLNKDIFTLQQQKQKNEVLETGVKLDVSYLFSKKLKVQSGYHFSETGISNSQEINIPELTTSTKNILLSHVLFGNARYTPFGKKTIINAGLRANYYSSFDKLVVEPRMTIHQKLGNGFAIEMGGEFKSQTTTQRIDFESDFLGVVKKRWVLANNDDVPTIKSRQASLGIIYNKRNWFVNLEAFYKKVKGITTSNQGFQNQFQEQKSIGNYRARGIEFTLNKKAESFSTWLSYVFMKNDYDFNTLVPSRFPNNLDIRHSATLASSFNIDSFKFALGVNWHTGKPFTIPIEGNSIVIEDGVNTINYDDPNAVRLRDYFRINFSTEYLWEVSDAVEIKINAALLNALDRTNTLNIRHALNSNSSGETRISQVEEVSLGFSPNFSIQVLF